MPLANSPPGMPAREPTIEQWENPVRFPDRDNGHRELGDPAPLVPAIREAVRRLLDLLPAHAESEVTVVAVSSLAEGADRLVACEVLAQPGWRLEVVLPLPASDYAHDFRDEQSRKEFRRLLRQASQVRQADRRSRRRQSARQRAASQVRSRPSSDDAHE